jgi:hypothetical protein
MSEIGLSVWWPPEPPWRTIWLAPRKTMRRLLDKGPPTGSVALLAALAGVNSALMKAAQESRGDHAEFSAILLNAGVFAPIGGLVTMLVWAGLLGWTGRWLGGRAGPGELRTAVAWSQLPTIVAGVLWLPALAVFGERLFMSEPLAGLGPAAIAFAVFTSAAMLTAAVWSFVLQVFMVAETQRFSARKALANMALVVLAIMIPVFTLVFLMISALGG